ncbi:MAG TPA: hypoxanthine phosphoribosyltransferase [Gammaproteobacteria bacterium]|nr:phosphoribosyltransferase family protein [Gammaproteobacteria bacterium]HAY41711.1 hypoxanthine phosphoribosyltransferase [Gammaproteobacteria bacterium]
MNKTYISAEELLLDSFRLGVQIHNSGFKPDFIVAIWRGGTPIGIAVQEILAYLGNETDHIAIRTSSYTGIGTRLDEVRIHGLDYLIKNINSEDKLLIVDDVFDSGRTIEAIIQSFKSKSRLNMPNEIKVAMPWFKPNNNDTDRVPEFYLHETDDWLVFPHSLEGLNEEEVYKKKNGIKEILSKVNSSISAKNEHIK